MNVWWCAVHDSPMETMSFCTRRLMFHGDSHQATSCSRRGALVLVRDAEGNWPQWALGVLVNILFVGPVPNWDAPLWGQLYTMCIAERMTNV